jgi:hypothetical protein
MIGEILPQHFANDTRTEQLSNENTHMKSGSAGRAPRGHQGTATIRVPSVLRNRLKVNDNDIVPLVPPPLPIDYQHVGHARYFDGSGRLHRTRTVWERIAEQLTPALGVIAEGGKGWNEQAKAHVRDRFADHGMARYIECLERLDAVRSLWSIK